MLMLLKFLAKLGLLLVEYETSVVYYEFGATMNQFIHGQLQQFDTRTYHHCIQDFFSSASLLSISISSSLSSASITSSFRLFFLMRACDHPLSHCSHWRTLSTLQKQRTSHSTAHPRQPKHETHREVLLNCIQVPLLLGVRNMPIHAIKNFILITAVPDHSVLRVACRAIVLTHRLVHRLLLFFFLLFFFRHFWFFCFLFLLSLPLCLSF